MQINRAYRYELDPTVKQRVLLAKHAGTARFAYNWGLAHRIALYEESKKSTNAIAQHKELNVLKKADFPWMYEVSKCAPQEALRNLDNAFKRFFAGIKAKRKVGFPRFKRKGVNDSFRLTGNIRVLDKAVQFPRLGVVRLKEQTAVKGRILSATMRCEAGRWHVSIAVEVDVSEPVPVQGLAAGIDVGLNHFATIASGDSVEKIKAPKPLAKHLRKLRRLSRQHSKKQKGSKNRRKSAMRLACLHRRIKNIRLDFLHKLSTPLAKTKSEIVLEDLHVAGMLKNRNLARGISDVGWGEFRRQLTYKCRWYGSRLVLAPRFYPSSKTCADCGHKVESLPLSMREWVCPECGMVHDRDANAARNLLALTD